MIVEVVSKGGRVMDIHAFQKNRIRIGRGYGNDLILQDPYLDADHLDVEYRPEHDVFSITDLHSVNGTSLTKPTRKISAVEPVAVMAGKIVCAGKTHLRFLDKRHNLPSALKLSLFEPAFALLASWWVSVLCIAAIMMLTYFSAYLTDPFSEKLLKEMNLVVAFIVAAIAYGALWVLMARINRGEGRFLLNANILLLMLVFDSLIQLLMPAYSFNLAWLVSSVYVTLVLTFFLIAVVVFISAKQTLHLSTRAAAIVASALGFLFIMTDVSKLLFPPDFRPIPAYNMTVVTPSLQLRGGVSEQEFLDKAQAAFVVSDDIPLHEGL